MHSADRITKGQVLAKHLKISLEFSVWSRGVLTHCTAHARRFEIQILEATYGPVDYFERRCSKDMEFKGGKTRKGQNGPQEKNIQVVVRCR